MFIMRAIFVRVWVKASVCPVGGGSCPSIFYFYNKLLSFFCRERIETACDLASDEESVFCMLIPDWATNNLVIIIVQVSILNQAMQ